MVSNSCCSGLARLDCESIPVIVKCTFIEVVVDEGDDAYKFGRRRSRTDPWSRPLDLCLDDETSEASTVDTALACPDAESETTTPVAVTKRRSWFELMESEDAADQEAKPLETRTTIMLRNLPKSYTRDCLTALLTREGFMSSIDFLYLPSDLTSGASFQYAFLNMVSATEALRAHSHFDNFDQWGVPSTTTARVEWSTVLQGLDALIGRYRNSPLMHESVPDVLRPLLLCDGCRQEFPGPTVTLKAPRCRRATNKKAS